MAHWIRLKDIDTEEHCLINFDHVAEIYQHDIHSCTLLMADSGREVVVGASFEELRQILDP